MNELEALSNKFNHIYFFTYNKPSKLPSKLPQNVTRIDIDLNQPVYLRNLIKKYYSIFIKWFGIEFIKSPFRLRYITNFKWHFNRLAGLLNNAIFIKNKLASLDLENPVYYTFWFDDWGTILSLMKEMDKKFNFIARVHLFDFEEEFSNRKYIPFRNVEITKPKLIIPISQYAVDYIKEKYRIESKLLRLGVPDRGNNPTNVEETYNIVSCSSISWYKRPLMLVQIVSMLRININWFHFGDGEMEAEFLAAIKNLPINIKFHYKGRTENDLIVDFYSETPIDLFLNVSEYEGIPVTMMEAISFGIPIIGCNVCGVPEIVNKDTGLLLEKDPNIKNTALEIEAFIRTKARNSKYRNGVKDFWNKAFNAKVNSEKVADLLYQYY